jgi:monoterpene epsilon-lactone hydrolase
MISKENPMTRQQRIDLDTALRSAPHGEEPDTIEAMREGFAALMAAFPVPATGPTSDITLGGRPAVLVEPASDRRPGTILYFHGGSWALGSPATGMVLTANLVNRTGVRAISLDYRLAPEHPFPAAIDDGLAAYRELLEDGVEASSIVFAGDSAGGGLSVTTALAARAARLPLPAAIVTFSAGLDATRSGESLTTRAAHDPFLTPEGLAVTGAMYLAGHDPHQELLAPAVLADLTGFPPLLLQVGTNEILLDDSTRLAERAREAGVDVILDVTADVPHVFQGFAATLPEADQAFDRAALFVRQRLAVAA